MQCWFSTASPKTPKLFRCVGSEKGRKLHQLRDGRPGCRRRPAGRRIRGRDGRLLWRLIWRRNRGLRARFSGGVGTPRLQQLLSQDVDGLLPRRDGRFQLRNSLLLHRLGLRLALLRPRVRLCELLVQLLVLRRQFLELRRVRQRRLGPRLIRLLPAVVLRESRQLHFELLQLPAVLLLGRIVH